MDIEREAGGDYLIASAEVAARFRISIAELRRLTTLGLMSSSVETGEGEDAGTSRLTLRCGNRVWRAVLDAHDHVSSEDFFVERARPPRR
ncbi:MAG: hypothetical protein JWM36_2338 [Hyphomicrobiales bacterium]|nr:hypothetical protein [Hyphomicrobiales bacterium]